MPEAVHIDWQPIGEGRASEAIYGQLRALITSGVLKPGDRLPSERAMMEQLHRITGMEIPKNLRGLEGRPVRHKDVIDKDQMLDYVLADVLK